MHLKNIVKKKENLEKIFLKANSQKNILLVTIAKLNNQLKFYARNAFNNKEIINQISSLYNIENSLIEKEKNIYSFLFNKFQKEKELWIYLKEKEEYSVDSYSRYEKIILNNVKSKKIDFIALNESAKNFLQKNNLKILKTFDLKVEEISTILSTTIKFLYLNNNYKKVNFILNSNKNYNSYFTILPLHDFDISKFNLDSNSILKNSIDKYSIYPNVNNFVDNTLDTYIENVVNSLIVESKFYKAKNNLVKFNKVLKDIDQKIFTIKRKIAKIKQEKEIEEIALITKNNSKFNLMFEGENEK
ncbi:MSC_0622 family F1-like ATPase gamma subunit [Mesomycoplasma neurolyticum]|uniref:Uncharacterized protein n=1 Tax=Mesomycoplasma neurolyticum TaxID=2120 RepID=A0A449A4M6_9BACT|nr:hypothetical protein [Mesomycoplasma neurolyticum]VEU59188.1 Uncharacterised protein [Mesomycoplasma neurolyticum]